MPLNNIINKFKSHADKVTGGGGGGRRLLLCKYIFCGMKQVSLSFKIEAANKVDLFI